jgi:hypothetical protein
MGKIAKNNNKLHIANGISAAASFFGSVTDENGQEKYTTSPDRLLKPGTGSVVTGQIPFMLHGNDLGMGAELLALKGASVLVYTVGSNEPDKFTISGANNLVLACVLPNPADNSQQILIVDNIASESGCKLYSITQSQFQVFLNQDGVVEPNVVDFDFSGVKIGHYGNSLHPDPTGTVNDSTIAGGDYIGDGFNTNESSHFLYNEATASGINNFFITDIKATAALSYQVGSPNGYPTILFQFQNPANDTVYAANECIIYKSSFSPGNQVTTLTFDNDNLLPAFAPCEWMSANRSLISKDLIDNGGNTSYFNATPDTNLTHTADTSKPNFLSNYVHGLNRHNQISEWRGNIQLSESGVVFPCDDISYFNAAEDGFFGTSTSGQLYASWQSYKFDLYGRVIGQAAFYESFDSSGNHQNMDSHYEPIGSRYKGWQFCTDEGLWDGDHIMATGGDSHTNFDSHNEMSALDWYFSDPISNPVPNIDDNPDTNIAIHDVLKGMGGLWFHGNAYVNYPQSAIIITKRGSASSHDYQTASVLVSPAPSTPGNPSNFWAKYKTLTAISGFENLTLNGTDSSLWDGNGVMLASLINEKRFHEAKMDIYRITPDDILSLPMHSGYLEEDNWAPNLKFRFNLDDSAYHSAFMPFTGHSITEAVRTRGSGATVDAIFSCQVPEGTPRATLKSAGHPLFLIDTSADDMVLRPMHTLKNWKSNNPQAPSLIGASTTDEGTNDLDSFGNGAPYGNAMAGNGHYASTEFFGTKEDHWAELSNFVARDLYELSGHYSASINAVNPYDYNGYGPWSWNYIGDLGFDRIISNMSVADVNSNSQGPSMAYSTYGAPNGITETSTVKDVTIFNNYYAVAYDASGAQKIFNHGTAVGNASNYELNTYHSGPKILNVTDGLGSVPGGAVFSPTMTDEESTTIFSLVVDPQAGDDDNFIAPYSVNYKYSFMYDGYQESPLSLTAETDSQLVNNKEGYKVKLSFNLSSLDYRITHVNIYSKYKKSNGSGDTEYKLSKSIPFRPIERWGHDPVTGLYEYEYFDRNDVNPTYETLTSIPESISDSSMMYTICTAADSYLFVAGCSQPTLADNFSHYIFRSVQGSFSQFNWSRDFQILPELPIAMQSFNGKLYIFSSSRTFKLNQASLEIEDDFTGAGCMDSRAIVSTEYGLCFADQKNIYLHDGRSPQVISQSIARGGKASYPDGLGGWQDVTKENVCITFDGHRKSFLIFFSFTGDTGSVHRCWAYNLLYKRWDLLSSPGKVIDTHIEINGTVIVTTEDASIYRVFGGSEFKPWTWVSKDIVLNNATQDKKLKKVRINSTANIPVDNIKLSYNNGTDIAYTAVDELSQSGEAGLHHKAIKPNTSTTFKSAQISLEEIAGQTEVDSLGLIYRPKSIK